MATHRAPAYDADTHTPAEHDGLFRTSGGLWVPKSVKEKLEDQILTANGDLLYRNGSGAATRLPKSSTDGDVLTMVSGLPAWAAAGGGKLEHLETIDESTATSSIETSASLAVGKSYVVRVRSFIPATNGAALYVRFKTTSEVSSGYYFSSATRNLSGSSQPVGNPANQIQISANTVSTVANGGWNGHLWFAQEAGRHPVLTWMCGNPQSDNNDWAGHGQGRLRSTTSVTELIFRCSTGNITELQAEFYEMST